MLNIIVIIIDVKYTMKRYLLFQNTYVKSSYFSNFRLSARGKKRLCFGNNELLKYISVYTSHVQSLWMKDFRAGHKTVNSMYVQQLLHNTSNSLWNVHRSTAKAEQKKKSKEYSIAHNNVLFVWFLTPLSCFSAAVEISVYLLSAIWSDLRTVLIMLVIHCLSYW
jgi:hypothetical protein